MHLSGTVHIYVILVGNLFIYERLHFFFNQFKSINQKNKTEN